MRVIFSCAPKKRNVSPTTDLFNEIDLNNDGRICKEDVTVFLKKFDVQTSKETLNMLAESFFRKCGVDSDGFVSKDQFAHYVHEQDRRLSPVYAQLDRKMEGTLDLVDIQTYFLKLGISIELSEAKRLLRRVNKTESEDIQYAQWRKFLLFQPICDLVSIAHYWRDGSVIDLSCDPSVTIPKLMKQEHILYRDVMQLIAGGVAGVISRTCTAPIDRLKVMRQVHGYKHKQSGFIEAYRYMFREGGILSLWRGNLINAVKIAPETAVKYTTYERYKSFLLLNDSDGFFDEHPTMTKFVSGAMAGLTAQTAVYPMEVLRTRMCLRKTGQYSSIVDCSKQIYQQLGIRGFFRGYGVNLVGIIPYAGIELATYESLKSAYIYRYMSHVLNLSPRVYHDHHAALYVHTPAHMIPILAAMASMLGIVFTYPMALIRAKMQASFYWSHPISASSSSKVSPSAVPQRPPVVTVPSLLRAIWRDDGVIGFYRGLGTNLIKVLPATAISLLTYETIRRELNLGPMGSG